MPRDGHAQLQSALNASAFRRHECHHALGIDERPSIRRLRDAGRVHDLANGLAFKRRVPFVVKAFWAHECTARIAPGLECSR